MGNSNRKELPKRNFNARPISKSQQTYSSQFSLSNFLPNISGRSVTSVASHQSSYSVSRPWSRVSRRRWHPTTLNDPLVASKTAWPVPYIEAVFLPDFKIKGDITEKDFEVIGLISKGAFGTVYKVRKYDTDEEYALKVLSKSLLISQNAVEQVKDEVNIQSVCGHHPFIVNNPFCWQNRKQLFIVSEYMAGGELLQLCQDYGSLPEELTRIYVAEVALAIDFLHNAGIIYRDLKLENILLDSTYHVNLIDFGLSKWLKYGNRTTTICGTLLYMAPEILSMEPYGHSVDWWSLGIVMCCMLSGEFPTPIPAPNVEKAATEAKGSEDKEETRLTVPDRLLIPNESFSPAARTLVGKLLEIDPRARLHSMLALKASAFFHGFNMEDVRSRKFQPKTILERYFPNGPPVQACPSGRTPDDTFDWVESK